MNSKKYTQPNPLQFRVILIAGLCVVLLLISTCKGYQTVSEDDLYVDPERMEEWNDWRFGMFIHWGPWSQTEIGYIWQMVKHEPREIGETRFELYKTFNPTKFDPKKWARAAKGAGMKYVVFVTKHHDGFNNYDKQLSMSNSCPSGDHLQVLTIFGTLPFPNS